MLSVGIPLYISRVPLDGVLPESITSRLAYLETIHAEVHSLGRAACGVRSAELPRTTGSGASALRQSRFPAAPTPACAAQVIVYIALRCTNARLEAAREERENTVIHAVLERPTAEAALSDEEVSLLAHLAAGMTADVAARRLDLSSRTLRRRVRSICDRLDVNTPIQAVVWAAKRGII